MNIQHFEKGLHYNDKELLIMARKVGKLATYCSRVKDEASLIRVEAVRSDTKKNRDQVTVAITVELPHKVLRSESLKNHVIEALDRALEKMKPQLDKYKELHSGKAAARKR